MNGTLLDAGGQVIGLLLDGVAVAVICLVFVGAFLLVTIACSWLAEVAKRWLP